ncbi:MAG: hypothetical protein M3Q03_12940, partial [Chloroflexota bacterium]|nr:hypothetical protein [Chloroflexota bacterium]
MTSVSMGEASAVPALLGVFAHPDDEQVGTAGALLGCVFKGVVTLGDEPRPRTDRRAVGGAGTAPAAAAGRDRAT